MRLRRAVTGALLLLGGCAGPLSSTLAPAPALALVGVAVPGVPAAGLDAELARLEGELGRRLTGRDWGVPLLLTRGAGPWIRIRLGADASFEGDTAQLQAGALRLYAEVAAVLQAAPGTVAHVLVHGDAVEADPAAGLTARRAASVQNYLASRQVAPTRLRAEGRANREPASAGPEGGAANRRVELVLKPVVAGREAEAWLPPAPAG